MYTLIPSPHHKQRITTRHKSPSKTRYITFKHTPHISQSPRTTSPHDKAPYIRVTPLHHALCESIPSMAFHQFVWIAPFGPSALRPWRVPFHAKRTTPLGSHAAAKLLIKEQVTKVSCRLIVLGTSASFPFCFRGLLAPVRPGTAGKTCNVFRGRWGNTGTLAQCLVDTAWNMLPRLFRLIGCCLLWC